MIILNIILYLALFVIVFRILRYVTTPLFNRLGIYKYYSKMFFTVPIFYRVREIHIGTSWDFFRIMNINPLKLLIYLGEGLVNLCKDIEDGKVDSNTVFRGVTFYMKPETLMKFGFEVNRLGILDSILFAINYIEICVLISISKRKLSLVSLKNIRVIKIQAKDIINSKLKFENTLNKLINRYTNESNTATKYIKTA